MKKDLSLILSTHVGSLGVINSSDIPFHIKRIYWLFDTPIDEERGLHAHKKLRQYLFCASGQVEIEIDDGELRTVFTITSSGSGILIEPCRWRVLRNFAPGTSVVVLASEEYDADDYIHDYEVFKEWKTR